MADPLPVLLATQALVIATPLLLAGLGELVAERAGIINIGIEGLMLTGAIAGYAGAVLGGGPWLGLAAAVAASTALAALFALVVIPGRADQVVAGLALNLLALGGSGVAWSLLQERGYDHLPEGAGFARGWLPEALAAPLQAVPWIGPVAAGQYALLPIALVLAAVTAAVLARTRLGLILRALGDGPDGCAAAGIAVQRWRFLAVLGGGAAAGVAGAYLSLMRSHGFVPHLTGGIGFVVLALVLFGRWRVGGLVAGCLLFGLMDAVQAWMQGRTGDGWRMPYQLWQMLPYAMALAVLACWPRARAGGGPQALGRPWPA